MASNGPSPDEAAAASDSYSLYIFPFSLYSIMARFTYALGRKGASSHGGGVQIENQLINLHRNENVAEDYLLTVNPKGQVPALTGDALSTPLTDSLDISYWLCGHYPRLLPTTHESEIRDLLSQLHNIQGMSLSVPTDLRHRGVPCPAVDALLDKQDISPEYRRVLEFKRQFHRETLETALEEDRIRLAEENARQFFADVLTLHDANGDESPWLLGKEVGPTVLDGHTVPFIARLLDARLQRYDLVPEKLQGYASRVMRLSEWDEVMHGRPTIWNITLGHVRVMNPI